MKTMGKIKNVMTGVSFALGLIIISQSAFAGLPTPSTNNRQQQAYSGAGYNQGMGNGASYYPNNYQQGYSAYQQPQYAQQQQPNSVQKVSGMAQTGGDLLWLFTGSEGSIRDQVKSGFHSDGQSTFGNRLFGVFLGAVYSRFLAPISNKLGDIGNKVLQPSSVQASQNPYANQGANYCYACTQQNSTNPNARNTQAMDPRIFNTGATGTGNAGVPGAAGGIR